MECTQQVRLALNKVLLVSTLSLCQRKLFDGNYPHSVLYVVYRKSESLDRCPKTSVITLNLHSSTFYRLGMGFGIFTYPPLEVMFCDNA